MNTSTYNLGLVSVSFRGHSPEEILDAMCHTGLRWIEWGSDVHAPCNDIPCLESIAKLQANHGIRCSSYGTYFRLGETPIAELDNYIRAAKILNTRILRLWCGNKCGKDMTPEERKLLADECCKAAEIARQRDVILCMECHRNTFTQQPEDAVWLMEQVNSPHFRMYWQPFQWQTVEENMQNAEKIAPYAHHIHVFNWKGDDKFPLAEAIEEWQGYLTKFSTPRTLLLEFMPGGTLAELAAEASALKTILGDYV